jgi:putative ABC transport system permease protein
MLLKIAFRNIFRNRRRSLITLMVLVMGATGLILFRGYTEMSFYGLRESAIRNNYGHVQVYGPGYLEGESQKPLEHGLENLEAVRSEIEADSRVKMTAAQITLMGLVSNGDKSETFIATAVEPEKDRNMGFRRLDKGEFLTEEEWDAVLVGKGLAKSLRVEPGDYLTLMTTTVTGSLNGMDVRVAGIFTTGVKEYDDRAIKMPIAGAQQFLVTDKIEKLLVILHDTRDTQAFQNHLGTLFNQNNSGLETRNWSDLATYYHQVRLIFSGIFGFIGTVVLLIVILSVSNTIIMSIFERTREIGTLMAIGTTRRRVWGLFLVEGLLIGLIGGVLGIAIGAGASGLVNLAGIQMPPPPGFSEGYPLRVMLTPPILVTVFILSLVTATVSSVYPALRASRLNIVDALGHI